MWMKSADNYYYYMVDGNKNIVGLVDEAGAIANSYEYSPFGKLINEVESVEQPFKFSSEYFDSETNLCYYNYRYYDPNGGKWLKRDPIAEEGGYNLYCFIQNNPVYGVDLLGLRNENYIPGNGYSFGKKEGTRYRLKFEIDGSKKDRKILPRNTILLENSTMQKAWADFKNRIEKLFQKKKYHKKCHCIEYLLLIQHGIGESVAKDPKSTKYHGRLSLFDKEMWRYSHKPNKLGRKRKNRKEFLSQDTNNYLGFIAKYLCKDNATVEFFQCAAGHGPDGKALKADLKSVLGKNTRVILYTTNAQFMKFGYGLITVHSGTWRD